jgi:hypothetical protein
MELVAYLRLSKQALIDPVFFCGVPIVLAMFSAVLGPYLAVMGGAGAAVYILSLAIVPWCLTGLVTQCVRKRTGRSAASTPGPPSWAIRPPTDAPGRARIRRVSANQCGGGQAEDRR